MELGVNFEIIYRLLISRCRKKPLRLGWRMEYYIQPAMRHLESGRVVRYEQEQMDLSSLWDVITACHNGCAMRLLTVGRGVPQVRGTE